MINSLINQNHDQIKLNIIKAKEGYIKPVILPWSCSKNKSITLLIIPISIAVNQKKEFLLAGIFIDAKEFVNNIISNKFCTIVSRVEPKDFIDFYCINKKLKIDSLSMIYEDARKKDAIFDDPPTKRGRQVYPGAPPALALELQIAPFPFEFEVPSRKAP